MKTKISNYLLIFTLLVTIVFCGCTSTPIIDGEEPFVVSRIYELSDGMCKYIGGYESTLDGGGFNVPACIVLPKRMYNIGDTISFKK